MSEVLTLDRVSMSFRVPRQGHVRSLEHILFGGVATESFQALHATSFTVTDGEWFGIIGPNGSGKSTLLRCIAGVYQPTTGTITSTISIAPVFAFGAGFNLGLTARDNIYINALALGLSRAEIDAVYFNIIDFAGLREFTRLPLKYYSAGMIRRLGFAITLQIQDRILVLDEIFAAGDLSFRRKSLEALRKRKAAGQTIVMVSHGFEQVKTFCDRALYLRDGVTQFVGDAEEAVQKYAQEV